MVWHLFLGLAVGACLPVEGDRILMRDLAAAIPAFASADGAESVGFAPVPGSQRRFSAGELSRLAARHDIAAGMTPVCFERSLEDLTEERLLAALREALPRDARLEIVDFSRIRIPKGRIEFLPDGLSAAPVGSPREPAIWRGHLKYGEAQSLPLWAKARIWTPRRGVVADRDLPAGKRIDAAAIRIGEVDASPFTGSPADAIEEVDGLAPRRPIRAGQLIFRSALESAAEVARGEMVGVEARSGAAFIRYEVRAEASGRIGDAVPVRNVESGKSFRARVIRKGWVAVE